MLCNLSSPVDVLILQSCFGFSILQLSYLNNKSIQLNKITNRLSQFKFGFGLLTSYFSESQNTETPNELRNIIQSEKQFLNKNEKCVFFFEGGKTNNTCVLKFDQSLKQKIVFLFNKKIQVNDNENNFNLILLDHSNKAFCNANQNSFIHFMSLFIQKPNLVNIRMTQVNQPKKEIESFDLIDSKLKSFYTTNTNINYIERDFNTYKEFLVQQKKSSNIKNY